jgi:glycosyltransferase involved in cell wall biosynthesis
MEMISLITICKNRLNHLKQTLPAMLQQSDTEVIVVDYGCEQGTAAWVKDQHPEARIVEVSDDAGFCAARARNLGAMQASGDVLFFIDADVLIRRDLGAWAKQALKPRHYYRHLSRHGRAFVGTCICYKTDFQRLEGYDEAFRLWGGEDMDFYERLDRLAVTLSPLPDDSFSGIEHGDEIRQLGWASDRPMLSLANQIYRLVKFDISLLAGQVPPLATRLDIRAQIDKMVKLGIDQTAAETLVLKINLDKPLDTGAFKELGGGIKRQLVYELKRSEGKHQVSESD